GAELFPFRGLGLVEAGNPVFGRAISDVFVVSRARLLLAEQRLLVGSRDFKRGAGEKQDITGFELKAELDAASSGVLGQRRGELPPGVLHGDELAGEARGFD